MSRWAKEDWWRGLAIGVLTALIPCAFEICVSNWDITNKALGIAFILLFAYIVLNEFDKFTLKVELENSQRWLSQNR